jgi:hypothetical protein
LNELYAPGSTVFEFAMGRSEPGRLGAIGRSREYFGAGTRLDLKLSPVDTVLCGSDAGVASYTFRFPACGPRRSSIATRQAKLRFAQEHFSAPVA